MWWERLEAPLFTRCLKPGESQQAAVAPKVMFRVHGALAMPRPDGHGRRIYAAARGPMQVTRLVRAPEPRWTHTDKRFESRLFKVLMSLEATGLPPTGRSSSTGAHGYQLSSSMDSVGYHSARPGAHSGDWQGHSNHAAYGTYDHAGAATGLATNTMEVTTAHTQDRDSYANGSSSQEWWDGSHVDPGTGVDAYHGGGHDASCNSITSSSSTQNGTRTSRETGIRP